jgi:hypothetical protein
MWSRRFAVFLLCLGVWCIGQSRAQLTVTSVGGGFGAGGGGGGYTGQGDIVSGAIAWSGLRAYSAAKRGTKVANVCNPTDAVSADCVDWNSDATTGDLVATTINGANCTSVTCDVRTLYDQTGNTACNTGVAVPCDYSQQVKAQRPTLVQNCVTTKWCMSFNGTTAFLQTQTPLFVNSSLTLSLPVTESMVFFHTNTGRQDYNQNGGVNFSSAANQVFASFGTFTPLTVGAGFDGAWHVVHFLGSPTVGANGDIHVDSTTNSNDLGQISLSAAVYCGRNGAVVTGQIVECGYWGSAVSAANMNTMAANAKSYWGWP